MNRLRRFAGLSPAARGVFLYSVVLIVVVSAGIRLCAVATCTRYLAGLARLTRRVHGQVGAQETARLVYAAGSVVRARCLARSLVLGHILRASGASVEMRLGVSISAAGSLSAHAWIELDEVPMVDQPAALDRYAPFARIAFRPAHAAASRGTG